MEVRRLKGKDRFENKNNEFYLQVKDHSVQLTKEELINLQCELNKFVLHDVMRCTSTDIDNLKATKIAGVTDIFGGEGLFWLLKRIILDHEQKIIDLSIDVAGATGRIG